jgi:hypothetical protein
LGSFLQWREELPTTTEGITRTLLLPDPTKYLAWLSLLQNQTHFLLMAELLLLKLVQIWKGEKMEE